jgi:acetoin utilization deacetylase AcuC-like enzyme
MEYQFPIFYSDLFVGHNTGVAHPENAGRLTAIVDYLKSCQKTYQQSLLKELKWAEKVRWIEPSVREVLPLVCQVHDSAYVSALKALANRGGGHLDGDTVLSAQSYDLALLAVAAWLDGADWVHQHQQPAFALVRPPGHHAERAQGMGFCLLSNAAISAHYALNHLNVRRVAILDWDVHHGNGTQSLVESHPQIAYCSFHQQGAYPGTGAASEQGLHHNVLNLPMPAGSNLADYQRRWEAEAAPFLAQFDADFMIVSAGYDATQADPLAGMALQPKDYGWFTQVCMQMTPRILFGLEGGYDYRALAESVAATIRSAVCCVL